MWLPIIQGLTRTWLSRYSRTDCTVLSEGPGHLSSRRPRLTTRPMWDLWWVTWHRDRLSYPVSTYKIKLTCTGMYTQQINKISSCMYRQTMGAIIRKYEILCICQVYIPVHEKLVLYVEFYAMHGTRSIFSKSFRFPPFRSLHQLFIFTLSTINFVVRNRRQTACSIYLVLYCLKVYDLEIPNHVCVKCFCNCRSIQFYLSTSLEV